MNSLMFWQLPLFWLIMSGLLVTGVGTMWARTYKNSVHFLVGFFLSLLTLGGFLYQMGGVW